MKGGRVRNQRSGRRSPRTANVAVLVLWAIALLAVFAIHIGAGVRQRLDFLGRLEARHDLRWIARAGIEKALGELGRFENLDSCIALTQPWAANPAAFRDIPVGRGTANVSAGYRGIDFCVGENAGFDIAVRFGGEDEQAKLNLNTAPRQVLVRLFVTLGVLDIDEADEVASAIVDWRDTDSQSLAHGAEDAYYHGQRPPSECKDAPFESLEELLQVRGMTSARWEQLRPYVTVFGSGSVNLNTAPRPVLAALGFSTGLQEKILLYRCGDDAQPATADDRLFVNAADALALLGQTTIVSESEAAEMSAAVLQGLVTTDSQIFSFQSAGRLLERRGRCLIRCVAEKDGERVTVREWRTQYVL